MEEVVDVKVAREAAGLTQAEAAKVARISVATWRRAEDDLSSVSAKTRSAVERVLKATRRRPPEKASEPSLHARRLNESFHEGSLTPAMAVHLSATCGMAYDMSTHDQVDLPDFMEELPDSVLFRVQGNLAWREKLAENFQRMASLLDNGVRPRPQNLAEEYVLHAAIGRGRGTWSDMPPWQYVEGIERRSDDPDWDGVAFEISRFPFGFPRFTEDEIADHIGSDGRIRLSRLHPFRWWEPLNAALDEWRKANGSAIAAPEFIARVLLGFLRRNRDIVDEIFEGDLYAMDFDAARSEVLLRDASGFTAVLTVTRPDVVVPVRENPFQAFVYASNFVEHIFRTYEENRVAECGACGSCEDCEHGGYLSESVSGRDAWRQATGLSDPPDLIDVGRSEDDFRGHQAIGIKFGEDVVIRVTIIDND
ncbi:helix-turn-helix transcriptional regulator [Nonomuraea sp. NPDC050404]|uniref:helix-turn-helix domain-containing protein n=1 Tax=Nonomuraea sp. NPDC050404 TaxID=3155783 RepID=UPI0033C9A7B2